MRRRFGVTALAMGALLAGPVYMHWTQEAGPVPNKPGVTQERSKDSLTGTTPREWSDGRTKPKGPIYCVPREWSEPDV